MTIKNRVSDFFYYFIVGTLAAFSISANALAATVLEAELITVLIAVVILMIGFYFVFFNKYSSLIIVGAGALAAIITFVVLWRKDFQVEWFIAIKAYVNELLLFIMNAAPYQQSYNTILQYSIIFLISLVVAITVRNWSGFYAITLLGTIILAIPAIKNWEKSLIGRYGFILCFIILLLEKLNSFMVGRKSEDVKVKSSYALMSIPLSLLVIGASILMPTPDVSGNDFVSELYDAGSSVLKDASAKSTVFSDGKKKLGGPLVLGNEKVMIVRADENVYLSGLVMDTYTGSEWYSKASRSRQEIKNENDIYDISLYSEEEKQVQEKYFRQLEAGDKQVTIIPDNEMKTKRLYTPPFAHTLFTNQPDIKIDQRALSFHTRKDIPEDTEYTQGYTGWDYNSTDFQNALNNDFTGGAIEEDYLERYLQLPETLPQRVVLLAEELTKDISGDYAKLRAVETYLRTTFPYTTETALLPAGEDFVDYFLFTEKQGYCVYYATAMVVMARSQGIPTRYVEGFVMPSERNSEGNFQVTNQQAHAWVEGYFPEFGWVRFEPTASYSTPEVVVTPVREEETPKPEIDTEEEGESDDDGIIDVGKEIEIETEEPIKGEIDPTITIKETSALMKFVLIIVNLGVVLALAFRFLRDYHKSKFERIDNLPEKEKTVVYFDYFTKAAKALGYPMEAGETAFDYARRTETLLGNPKLTQLAEIFSKAAYSEEEISKQESLLMKESYYQLVERLEKKQNNPVKFALERYLLMRF